MEKQQLIYKELSYQIVGLLYEVYNAIGPGHREKYYQNGFEALLRENKINFQKELSCPLIINNKVIGRYFLDFLIDEKVVVELKTGSYFKQRDFRQIFSYLKTENLQLGILAYFTKSDVRFRRIVNLH